VELALPGRQHRPLGGDVLKARRGGNKLHRAALRCLALLASNGLGLNSLRSDNALPDPFAAALLSPATRLLEKIREQAEARALAVEPPFDTLRTGRQHRPCGGDGKVGAGGYWFSWLL